jgi:hypothetical protein
MRRSGALALGTVLMLGGISGGRADELSGSVAAGGSSSFGGFTMPTLPEDWNWSDLPVHAWAHRRITSRLATGIGQQDQAPVVGMG